LIAIHVSKSGFSDRWIAYCEKQGIPYKAVDCYRSDILEQLSDCDALLWHHNHAYPVDQLIAKQLLFSLEQAGKVVFPDFRTAWHYDDKLGQKYLFEPWNCLLSKPGVFSRKRSQSLGKGTSFPKVFKLRRGAGSRNVFLVKNKSRPIN
jgi:glutathione synthase/RimK-type ligase-like ATP-grasp enzyme